MPMPPRGPGFVPMPTAMPTMQMMQVHLNYVQQMALYSGEVTGGEREGDG